MTCSIVVQDGPQGTLIAISGDADLTSAESLRSAIERAAAGHERVVVDLNEATMIDSRTIGVLASWMQKLRSRGATMPIVCDDPNILRLFTTIGLEREFQFFPTREAAFGG